MATHAGSEGTIKIGSNTLGEIKSFSINETDAGQVATSVGSEITLEVYPEGSTTGDTYYSGTAFVTAFNVNSSFDGIVEAEISFQGSGGLTKTTV